MMSHTRSLTLLVALVAALQAGTASPHAARADQAQARQADTQAQPQQPAPADSAQPPAGNPQDSTQKPPTFRGGINFVLVDVVVTDKKGEPVTNLTEEDFEVIEDGKPQDIEQFRLVKVDGTPKPGAPPPRQIRSRVDEEMEAARDDVRVFVIFFDDYHVRRANSMSVREPLTRFVQTQLRPQDLVAFMYPLMPAADVAFTRNQASILTAIQNFEGRKFDYRPRNSIEEQYQRYPTEVIEKLRNEITMGALGGLAVRMGSLREGRKSIIFVSEGFTALLPPQMRRQDASIPDSPIETTARARSQDSPTEQTAQVFSQADLYARMRDVFDSANRNNAAIYSLDPRGLAPFEFGIDEFPAGAQPSFATDRNFLQATQDTLRTLSEETDGRAIVNRNSLEQGLREMIRDSSSYYLLGYNNQAPNDGKFHEIKVRVKRRDVDVRARKGYWALTPEAATRAATPSVETAKPVQNALATLSSPVQAARYIRTWIGTERGPNGKTRVTLVWEPVSHAAGAARRDQPGRVSLLAADSTGNLVFRGRSPDAALAAATTGSTASNDSAPSIRSTAAAAATGPQRIVFDAPAGKMELRLTVEGTGGAGTIDQESRTIEVPDLTAPQVAISTPRVYRARTARGIQAVLADTDPVPVATREFSRTERVLIRFDVYTAGTEQPAVTATLLNRGGQKMSDVPVTATSGGTQQIELGLSSIPPGEYLVEITVKGASGEVKELIPFRVGA